MLGAAANAGRGSELERAVHRSGVHPVRAGGRAEAWRTAGRGRASAGTGRDVAILPDGRRHTVADVAHSGADAGTCRWKYRGHARESTGLALRAARWRRELM